jgi:hypothetical protein
MTALLLGAVAGPVLLWPHGAGPLGSADTRIVSVPRHVLVLDANGEQVTVKAGDTLPRGARVRSYEGYAGLVVLDTRGRRVTVGPDSMVQVVDGGTQQLHFGSLVVDSRRGPRLTVEAEGSRAVVDDGSLVRLDRLLVTSYAGSARVGAAGDEDTVGRWRRAEQDGLGGLRSAVAGLADDELDRVALPEVVAVEDQLQSLAAALDDPVRAARVRARLRPLLATARPAVTASVSTALFALVEPDTRLADTALCVAMSAAGDQPLATLRSWRADGGSWVAMAGLAHADVATVQARFTELFAALVGEQPGVTTPGLPATPTSTSTDRVIDDDDLISRSPDPSPTDLVDDVVAQLPGEAATPVRSQLPDDRPTVNPPTAPVPQRSAYWTELLRLLDG